MRVTKLTILYTPTKPSQTVTGNGRDLCQYLQKMPLGHTETQNRLSWKGPFKAIWSNSPAVNRDTHSSIRCSEPHPLTLGVSRDGAPTTSLGNLCQCFTTLVTENFFLIPSLNLPSYSLKPFLLVLITREPTEESVPFFLMAPSSDTERYSEVITPCTKDGCK